jgi:adenosylhomocysteine nucleosidase
MNPRGIVVVAGLAFEARLAAAAGTTVCHGRGLRLRNSLASAVGEDCAGIISFGIAGGLDPRLRVGAPVVASAVVSDDDTLPTDARWTSYLLGLFPDAHYAPILGMEEPIADPIAKAVAFKRTGAAVVDMESHLVAAAARRIGVPFAVVRVVADPAHRQVPRSALDGMRPDGSADALAVLRASARRPAEVPHLFAVARDVWRARRALVRARRLLGARFGLVDEVTA